MIFAKYNYKNFHKNNKNEHPIQPPTIESWCKMVNEEIYYCKKFNWWKWTLFYFWFKMGRFRYVDLNSFHPYWKIEIKKDINTKLKLKYKC